MRRNANNKTKLILILVSQLIPFKGKVSDNNKFGDLHFHIWIQQKKSLIYILCMWMIYPWSWWEYSWPRREWCPESQTLPSLLLVLTDEIIFSSLRGRFLGWTTGKCKYTGPLSLVIFQCLFVNKNKSNNAVAHYLLAKNRYSNHKVGHVQWR